MIFLHSLLVHTGRGGLQIGVKKLPPVYKDGLIPSSLAIILFMGKVQVTWHRHTVGLLWAVDRKLAGLEPLNKGKHEFSHQFLS